MIFRKDNFNVLVSFDFMMTNIGRIYQAIMALLEAKNKTQEACFFLRGNRPVNVISILLLISILSCNNCHSFSSV